MNGNQFGGPQTGDANGGNYGGPYDPRQVVRELRERLNEIRELERTLGNGNPVVRDLQGIANELQVLINDPRIGDPKAIEKLANQIIDPLRGVETELSRALQILLAKENIRSTQEAEFPEGYAKYLEEYYKKLSTATPKQ